MRFTRRFLLAALSATPPSVSAPFAQSDPLPSGNDGPVKQAILEFVGRITREGGPDTRR